MAYDLNYYQSWLTRVRNQIRERERKNQKIRGEIERMERAYDKLKSIKRDLVSPMRKDLKLKNCAGDVKWRGQYKKKFDKVVDESVSDGGKKFESSIDKMMDTLNIAIRNKSNELDTGFSLLNGLKNTGNWLSTTIKNWVN